MLEGNRKYIVIGLVIVAISFIAYKLKNKNKEADPFGLDNKGKENKDTEKQLLSRVKADSSFPLKMGSNGERVKQLQKFIVQKGGIFNKYGVDGVWDVETEEQVFNHLNTTKIEKDFFINNKLYLL